MERTRKERKFKEWPVVDYTSFGAGNKKNHAPVDVTYQSLEEQEILPIEVEDAPEGSFRGSIEAEILRRRVRATLGPDGENVPVGKAFPIPTRSKSTVTTLLNKEYPALKFRFTGRAKDPFTRVVRKA